MKHRMKEIEEAIAAFCTREYITGEDPSYTAKDFELCAVDCSGYGPTNTVTLEIKDGRILLKFRRHWRDDKESCADQPVIAEFELVPKEEE